VSRKTGLLVLSLFSLTVLGLGVVRFSGRYPPPQFTDPDEQAFELKTGKDFVVLYVPERATAGTYVQQAEQGYHCTSLGTRMNAGMSIGFYWVCRNGAVPAQEDTQE
jgi:hypothetical protein